MTTYKGKMVYEPVWIGTTSGEGYGAYWMIVHDPGTKDEDVQAAVLEAPTIAGEVAVPYEDENEWEPQVYKKGIEKAGFKVLEIPDDEDGVWTLEWTGSGEEFPAVGHGIAIRTKA